MPRRPAWLLSLATVVAVVAGPQPAAAQLAQVETHDIRIVYIEGAHAFLVPHAARSFLNSLKFQRALFDFTPSEKPTILLIDLADTGNAAAGSVPRNSVRVQIAPMSYVFETMAPHERMTLLANHELVHVATMDQGTGSDLAFRRLFSGKVVPIDEQPESILYFYLTSPRVAAPRWYIEGIAVFVETWMGAGLGRAQSGYDEMVFRAMVRDGARFYDPLGLVAEGTKIDFQVEAHSYLYGGRFMTWLAYHHSPAKLIEWVSRKPGSKAYYSRQFREVFGTPLEAAWAEWEAFEHEFQARNLAEIRKHPVTDTRDLSPRALGSVSRAFFDPAANRLYAGLNFPGTVAHIGAVSAETGRIDHLADVKGPRMYRVTSLAWDPEANVLFYTADNGAYRDLVRLDLATRRTEVLQKDLRVGDLAFNRADRSIWGVRHLNGLASIVRIAPPYRAWTRVVSLPYGTVVYDLDVSPDGTMLAASFGEVSGQQNVRVLRTDTLLEGDLTPLTEFDFGGPVVPNGFVFSPDGRYLYGSSYYTGVSNIFRYEIATKALEAVTNAETGFFSPIPLGDDELIVFRYSGEGFVPTRVTALPLQELGAITFLGEQTIARHEVLKTWEIGSPMAIPFDEMEKTTRPYGLTGGLKVESLYPVVQGYKDTAAVGLRLELSDPLRLNNAHVTVTWSPDGRLPERERLHAAVSYERYDTTIAAAWNPADFYDLFGPTKRSRKGYTVGVTRTKSLVYDQPKRLDLKIDGRFAGGLDQLPQYQNVPVKVDRLVSVGADLSYSNQVASIGGVDAEKGRRGSLTLRGDYVNRTLFTRLYGTFDVGVPLPSGNSSIWVRSAAGLSPQDRGEPFANFFFGGFGNNYVDRAVEKQYRQYYSFPGADLNAIGGRNFARTMLEWNLPPLRFSRVGTPGAYLSWLRPAVFVSGLVTNLDHAASRRRAASAGAQVDLRFTILSVLDLTLSAGAGATVEHGRPVSRETMVSLRILR
ncbi:MAG TPA: hypothetical protein VMM93_03275 [Vicinamibacterales bacterium]|nr:hypothetical protein [Vicinamibacterales bacterium]